MFFIISRNYLLQNYECTDIDESLNFIFIIQIALNQEAFAYEKFGFFGQSGFCDILNRLSRRYYKRQNFSFKLILHFYFGIYMYYPPSDGLEFFNFLQIVPVFFLIKKNRLYMNGKISTELQKILSNR